MPCWPACWRWACSTSGCGGDSIFNLFSIPAYAPDDKALRSFVQDWHATLATTVLILAGVHAGAALVHRYLWHDGVLARMMPGRG